MTRHYLLPATSFSQPTQPLPARLVAHFTLEETTAHALLALREQLRNLQHTTPNITGLRLAQRSGLCFTDTPRLTIPSEVIQTTSLSPEEFDVQWYRLPSNEIWIGRLGLQAVAMDDPTTPTVLFRTVIFPYDYVAEMVQRTDAVSDTGAYQVIPGFTLLDRDVWH